MNSHAHQFTPGRTSSLPPLVLLHGSGGTETDLVPFAEELAPGSSTLGIRGAVAIDGGFAFFRRSPDRRIDEADIAIRAIVLADFIESCCTTYRFAGAPLGIGFSNGAIMAAALLLMRPRLFGRAILFRPLSPFLEDKPTRLDATPVLIIDGEKDTRRSPGDGLRLAERLVRAGARVTHHVLGAGHTMTPSDLQIARQWVTAS